MVLFMQNNKNCDTYPPPCIIWPVSGNSIRNIFKNMERTSEDLAGLKKRNTKGGSRLRSRAWISQDAKYSISDAVLVDCMMR